MKTTVSLLLYNYYFIYMNCSVFIPLPFFPGMLTAHHAYISIALDFQTTMVLLYYISQKDKVIPQQYSTMVVM